MSTMSPQFGTNGHHITNKHLEIMFAMPGDLVCEWQQLYCTDVAGVVIFDIFCVGFWN